MSQDMTGRIVRHAESGVAYHLLVGLVFAGCAPVAIAQAMSPKSRNHTAAARPFATALDTARNTVAQAYSLPG